MDKLIRNKNNEIVLKKDNEFFAIPDNDLQSSLDQGYVPATEQDRQIFNFVQENKGMKGALKVSLGNVLNELTLGATDAYNKYAQDPLENAKQEALAKDHDFADTASKIGGFGLSLFSPIGGANLIGKGLSKFAVKEGAELLTKKASENLASKLAIEGVESGAKGLANKIITSSVLPKVGAGAVEGIAYSLPKATTEAVFGDGQAAAESLLIGGTLGGLFEGTIEGAKKLFSGVKDGYKTYVNKLNPIEEGGIPTGEGIFGVKTKVKNADEIINAFRESGANDEQISELAPFFSGNKKVQELIGGMTGEASVPGQRIRDTAKKAYTFIDNVITETFGGAVNKIDNAELINNKTQSIFTKVTDLFENKLASTKDLYSVYNEYAPFIEVNPKGIQTRLNNAIKSTVSKGATTAEKSLSNWAQEYLPNINTLEDMDFFLNKLRIQAGESNVNNEFFNTFRSKLVDARETYLKDAISKMKTPEAKIKLTQALESRKEGDRAFRDFITSMEESGIISKKKSYESGTQYLERLTSLDDKSFLKVITNKNFKKFLDYTEKTDPGLKQDFIDLLVAKFKQNAVQSNGELSPKILINNVSKMLSSAEGDRLKSIFGDDIVKKVKNIELMNSIIPINPDKLGAAYLRKDFADDLIGSSPLGAATAAAADLAMTGGAVTGTVAAAKIGKYASPYLKEKYIRYMTPEIGAAVESKLKTVANEIDDAVPKVVNNMFGVEKIKEKISEPFNHANFKDNLKKAGLLLGIKYFQKDSDEDYLEKLQDEIIKKQNSMDYTSQADVLREGNAPQLADKLLQKQLEVVQILSEIMPKNPTQINILGKSKYNYSPLEIAEFTKGIDAITNPIGVIKSLPQGKTTKKQIDLIKRLYPEVYRKVQDKFMGELDKMIRQGRGRKINASDRIRLSYLLDINLEQGLNSISDFQKMYVAQNAQQGNNNSNVIRNVNNVQINKDYITENERMQAIS